MRGDAEQLHVKDQRRIRPMSEPATFRRSESRGNEEAICRAHLISCIVRSTCVTR